MTQGLTAKERSVKQIVAYENQSYILTGAGRILSWGKDEFGMLGRKVNNIKELGWKDFKGPKPPRTSAQLPGLVADIALG